MRIRTYLTLVFSALFASIFAVGCGDDDPGGRTRDPGPSPVSDTPSTSSLPSDGGVAPSLGSGYDAAAGYRDPHAGDGACSAPNQVCMNGDGGSACVDVSSDTQNCGKCGAACLGDGTVCIAGSCSCSAIGFLYCPDAGGCIDVTSDVNNCGQCGMVCDPSQYDACVGGTCTMQ